MDPLGENEGQRMVAPNLEQDEMNMRLRDRKAQEGGARGGDRYPRLIIHVPEWFSHFTVINRGLKLVLAGIAFVACTGSYLYISGSLPDATHESTTYGSLSAVKLGDTMNFGDPPPFGTPIPLALSNLADLTLPLAGSDIPLFLHLPRSGGNTIKRIMGKCVGLVQAMDGRKRGFVSDDKTFTTTNTTDVGVIVNADMYSSNGIEYARENILLSTGLVDAVSSPLIQPTADLFSSGHRGRVFTMLRHPIERATSYFYYIAKAIGDENYSPLFENISIEQYASTHEDRPEFNYLTKMLSNNVDKTSQQLTLDDLNQAKEILEKKVLIGLLSEKEESIHRFGNFFGWTLDSGTNFCHHDMIEWEQAETHPEITPADTAWNLLWKKNAYDMDLFSYAQTLFSEQGKLFSKN